MTHATTIYYIIFTLAVLFCLALDLFVFHKDSSKVSIKSALTLSLFWIGLSLLFGGWMWWHWDAEVGKAFFAGYLLEYSLSMDNVFVIAMIFSYFGIPEEYRHRVLFWGIIGAIAMRAVMIAVGATAIARYEWILYVFGAFLLYTGFKMLLAKHNDKQSLENNKILIFVKKHFRVTDKITENHFLVLQDGKRMLTPLALALVMIELTDLVFAVDSIPAIFGVTQDAFIVFTSNICAILGLRSLFFLLSRMVNMFSYLHIGLSIILILIGIKMLLLYWDKHIPMSIFLPIVILILAGSIAFSVYMNKQKKNIAS